MFLVERRLDAAALRLEPLGLWDDGVWDPDSEEWGYDDPCVDRFLARGPRRAFEMQQVVPRLKAAGADTDPILEASELRECGERSTAEAILADLLTADLRCLDAHAHLGSFDLDQDPKKALRHYRAGVAIGDLSLGADFDGVLPWSAIDNRPFLRCLHGLGLVLWRLGRFAEARAELERMRELDPTDHRGVRSVLPQVRAGKAWENQAC